MKEKLEKIRDLANEILNSLENNTKTEVLFEAKTSESKSQETKEFSMLKELLNSDEWPEAVFQVQIADENSEKDKEERAEGIVDILLPPLDGKKFLDFGCGEGHVVSQVSKRNSLLSVGYDLEKGKSQLPWEEKQNNMLLTTDLEKTREQGPYDVILLYDVIDHTRNESPRDLMTKVRSLLSEDGKVYVRCHPWSSRHGGHLYRSLNKAFVHIVFEEKELSDLGLKLEHNQKIIFPMARYSEIFEKSEFIKETEPEMDTQEVENFFSSNPLVRSRILKAFNLEEWSQDRPVFQLSQCFVDYILKKK